MIVLIAAREGIEGTLVDLIRPSIMRGEGDVALVVDGVKVRVDTTP